MGAASRKRTWAEAVASDDDHATTGTADESTEVETLTWQDVAGRRHDFEYKEDLEVLGTLLAKNTITFVKHRLGRADAAFWRHKGFFCSPRDSWQHKLKEYLKRIRPIALYGSVLWI